MCATPGSAVRALVAEALAKASGVAEVQLASAAVEPGLLRLSVGLEHHQDILDDLTSAPGLGVTSGGQRAELVDQSEASRRCRMTKNASVLAVSKSMLRVSSSTE
jgi:Cys/Met metabolism PLP-dependent enzyme